MSIWALLISFLISIVPLTTSVPIDKNNPIVSTRYGQVVGESFTWTINSGPAAQQREVIQFIGIPYAKPPVGGLRFMPPQPPDPWQGPQHFNRRVFCPQVEQRFRFTLQTIIPTSEDCLHLNVYVPIGGYSTNMPVLVYFHGGEFLYGGKDMYRPDWILQQSTQGGDIGIIVVTVNYRLGILGFLSTDDINQPGNNGIRDQVMALRWVNENIGSFNGDPGKVTIMGHDAGAVSVSMHMLNDESMKFFTAAVTIGDTVFSPWAIETNPREQARNIGNFFRCDLRFDRLIECLRFQKLEDLITKTQERDWGRNYRPFWFRPVVDRNVSSSAILKDYPLSLYKKGLFHTRCSYMAGVASREGSLEYFLQADRIQNMGSNQEKIEFLLRPFLWSYTNEEVIAAAFNFLYFKRNDSMAGNFGTVFGQGIGYGNQYDYGRQPGGSFQRNFRRPQDSFIDLLGDFLHSAPIDFQLRLHTERGGSAWQFVFDATETSRLGPNQYQGSPTATPNDYGATHMEDMFYLFPNEYSLATGIGDQQIAGRYAAAIVALTKKNNPSFQANLPWTQYTLAKPLYARITRDNYEMSDRNVPGANQIQQRYLMRYRGEYMDFMNDMIYDLQRKTSRPPQQFPYEQYKGFQAATWSMVGLIILLIFVIVALIAVIVMRRKSESRDMTLIRRRQDKDLEERYQSE